MLNEGETQRITDFIDTDDSSLFRGLQFNTSYYISESRWLAEKCKELDDKCKELQLEIDQLKGNA